MPKLVFQAADMKRICEHALAAKTHRAAYGSDPKAGGPAIWLVGDQGVYVMSNGGPMDNINTDAQPRAFTAYAIGCDPSIDEDWHNTKRTIFGGDDGVDALPWCQTILDQITDGVAQIEVSITANDLNLLSPAPTPAPASAPSTVQVHAWCEYADGSREYVDAAAGETWKGWSVCLHVPTPDDPQQPFDLSHETDHPDQPSALAQAGILSVEHGVEIDLY